MYESNFAGKHTCGSNLTGAHCEKKNKNKSEESRLHDTFRKKKKPSAPGDAKTLSESCYNTCVPDWHINKFYLQL